MVRRTGTALALAGFVAILAGWLTGGGSVDLPWAPSLDIRFSFSLDGLGVLYGLLATGIGFAVFVYSRDYLPIHLRHQDRPEREETGFYAFLLLFMVSMVGLATAQDLIVLFVFWDLTAIASYYLIGFDRQDAKDRAAALMALLVTGASAVLLLVGALVLRDRYGTFAIGEILARADGDAATTTAAVLIAVAALAKSAQVPLHFWLPRAMVAPTPVSAYLHSAAMVAAGVFLLSRVYPLLVAAPYVLDGVLAVGIASMAIGGVLALTRDELKDVLAYSTIGQYGYVVFLLGLGTGAGVAAACFYVVVHAIAKCALFLTAGAVTATTGENRLSNLGGLARPMPLVAAGSAVAAAGIVALPATAGFFADELFFDAALERSGLLGAVALASAGLTFAYIGRFWSGIFLGPRRPRDPDPVSAILAAPIAVLGLVLFVFGFVTGPLSRLAEDAAEAALLFPVDVAVAYHLDLRAENLMALGAWAVGLGALATRSLWWPAATAVGRVGTRFGPERGYRATLAALNGLSDRIHDIEVRDLRTRVAAVFVPGGLLVALGIVVTPTGGAYAAGSIGEDDIGLVVVLAVATLGALATTFPRHHVTLVLVLSSVGFSLAVAYAFFGGPNVALVAVLIETVLALAFLGVLALLPRDLLRRESQVPTSRGRRWRDPVVGLVAGGAAFVVAWGALSRPAPQESVASELARLAPEAHAADIVTAILADFRGLDTLVEISVLAVALLGIAALLRGQEA
ncbi:MAG TPA: hydrogen gas-evolving membrane-bound hydrogenase subunit E [Gaiellaceae bacterium]|nr:hydrogen gas-evolving membrane-bound hydrogenase subunit E [Gaiellaceae bacterium]